LQSGFWHSFLGCPVTFDGHYCSKAGFSCQIFILSCKVFAQGMWVLGAACLRLLNR
jgi:hypothetical protein